MIQNDRNNIYHFVVEKEKTVFVRGERVLFRNDGTYNMSGKDTIIRQSSYARVEEVKSQWIMNDSE